MKPFPEAFDVVAKTQDREGVLDFQNTFVERLAHPAYQELLNNATQTILEDLQTNRETPIALAKGIALTIHTAFELGLLVGQEMAKPNLVI